MRIGDKRRHTRLRKNFKVMLYKGAPGALYALLEGNTLDLSQGGAFIKIEDYHSFKPNESMELTFILPSDFTGQDTAIGLQGSAIVKRVDRLREGIAVEFVDEFRQFKPTTMS